MTSVEEITLKHLPPDPAPTLAYLTRAEHWLRRQVYYLHDHENPRLGRPLDDWRTLLPEILRRAEGLSEGQLPVGDDCDAWSFTAIDIARFAGVDPDNCRLLLVLSPEGQIIAQHPLDHMVGAVRLDAEWYIVGDTYRVGPYSIAECPHVIYQSHALPIHSNDWRTVSRSSVISEAI